MPVRSARRARAHPTPHKRTYTMRARAEATEATRLRILDAASAFFLQADYDAVSLEAVAARARVSLQTVLRKFGSKEALVLACARERHGEEFAMRAVAAGDVQGVARVLAARYEETMVMTRRLVSLEVRIPAIAEVLGLARAGHTQWLADAFAPWLPAREGPIRARRLAALFGATEIYVWWSWRTQLGLDARAAERAMVESLEALTTMWRTPQPPAARRPAHD